MPATTGAVGACRHASLGFDAALRLGRYEGARQQAVLRMKNANHEGLAELVGERWAERERARFMALGVDAVVPVPLHWWRRMRRGYNQSAALAFGIASTLKLPYRRWWLRRSRYTPSQKELSAAARRANVEGAFRAGMGVRLQGKHILLVDDVMTTGATASEAARALKRAGARASQLRWSRGRMVSAGRMLRLSSWGEHTEARAPQTPAPLLQR